MARKQIEVERLVRTDIISMVLLIPACFLPVLAIFVGGTTGDPSGVLSLWVIVAIACVARMVSKVRRNRAIIRSAIERVNGAKPHYIDIADQFSAIAIGDDKLFVVDRGLLGIIPFEQVYEWESEVVTASKEVVYGIGPAAMAAQFGAGNRNNAAARQAANASGLFINVRDVDFPVWQFKTSNAGLLRRWHEILRQTFLEDEEAA